MYLYEFGLLTRTPGSGHKNYVLCEYSSHPNFPSACTLSRIFLLRWTLLPHSRATIRVRANRGAYETLILVSGAVGFFLIKSSSRSLSLNNTAGCRGWILELKKVFLFYNVRVSGELCL